MNDGHGVTESTLTREKCERCVEFKDRLCESRLRESNRRIDLRALEATNDMAPFLFYLFPGLALYFSCSFSIGLSGEKVYIVVILGDAARRFDCIEQNSGAENQEKLTMTVQLSYFANFCHNDSGEKRQSYTFLELFTFRDVSNKTRQKRCRHVLFFYRLRKITKIYFWRKSKE